MMLSGRRAVVVVIKSGCCGAGAGFLVNAVGPLEAAAVEAGGAAGNSSWQQPPTDAVSCAAL